MSKVLLLAFLFLQIILGCSHSSTSQDIDLTYVNDPKGDLRKNAIMYQPSLGVGLRDIQSNSGGQACTTCSH